MEILLDFKYNRLGLIALVPFLYCVSLVSTACHRGARDNGLLTSRSVLCIANHSERDHGVSAFSANILLHVF
jgi:hypothetical protein